MVTRLFAELQPFKLLILLKRGKSPLQLHVFLQVTLVFAE